MLGEGGTALAELQEAARKFHACEDRPIDLGGLREVIDSLEGDFSVDSRKSQAAGMHLAEGSATVVTWLSRLCDRQVNWSTPHHIISVSRGGPTRLPNLVLLCYFHHRLVHEGGWQVVQVGREFRFVPPDRVVFRRARAPGVRWAA